MRLAYVRTKQTKKGGCKSSQKVQKPSHELTPHVIKPTRRRLSGREQRSKGDDAPKSPARCMARRRGARPAEQARKCYGGIRRALKFRSCNLRTSDNGHRQANAAHSSLGSMNHPEYAEWMRGRCGCGPEGEPLKQRAAVCTSVRLYIISMYMYGCCTPQGFPGLRRSVRSLRAAGGRSAHRDT